MLTGAWRNFEHIEEELSLQELIEIVKAIREREYRSHKFAAALKGVNLDEQNKSKEDDPVEASKRRAALRRAKEAGLNEQQFEAKETETRLQSIGFAVVKK